jgi:hypothetical protein
VSAGRSFPGDLVRRVLFLRIHGERDEKRRSVPDLGFQPNLASVHLNDALRDGEAEPSATLLARKRIVGLLEFLEELGLVGRIDTWTGVTHRHIEGTVVRSALITTSPASVNLIALPTRFSRT